MFLMTEVMYSYVLGTSQHHFQFGCPVVSTFQHDGLFSQSALSFILFCHGTKYYR
jgi:hypothetical protein